MPSDPNLPGNINDPYGRRLRDLEEIVRGLQAKSVGAAKGPVRPIDVFGNTTDALNTVTLTTVQSTVLSFTLVRPTWATFCVVNAFGIIQITTTPAQLFGGLIRANGTNVTRSVSTSVPAGPATGAVSPAGAIIIGSTAAPLTNDVLVELLANVNSGTNGTNFLQLSAQVTWLA